MSERNSDSSGGQKSRGQDWLGLGLAVVFGFAAVSILLSLRGQESTNPLSLPVDALMNSLGPWAGMLLSLGLAGLGVAMFLRPEQMPSSSHLMGWIGSACGVSLIIGAVSPESGGVLGGLSPGWFGASAGLFVGLIVGLLVLIGSIWSVWISGPGRTKLPSHGALVPTRQADADGVSAEEALALQPVRETAKEAKGSQGALAQGQPRPEEDVRLHGGVPPGTQPLSLDGDMAAASAPLAGEPQPDWGAVKPLDAPSEAPAAASVAPTQGAAEDEAEPRVEPLVQAQFSTPMAEPKVLETHAPAGYTPPAPSWERLDEDEPQLAFDEPESEDPFAVQTVAEPEVADVQPEAADVEPEAADVEPSVAADAQPELAQSESENGRRVERDEPEAELDEAVARAEVNPEVEEPEAELEESEELEEEPADDEESAELEEEVDEDESAEIEEEELEEEDDEEAAELEESEDDEYEEEDEDEEEAAELDEEEYEEEEYEEEDEDAEAAELDDEDDEDDEDEAAELEEEEEDEDEEAAELEDEDEDDEEYEDEAAELDEEDAEAEYEDDEEAAELEELEEEEVAELDEPQEEAAELESEPELPSANGAAEPDAAEAVATAESENGLPQASPRAFEQVGLFDEPSAEVPAAEATPEPEPEPEPTEAAAELDEAAAGPEPVHEIVPAAALAETEVAAEGEPVTEPVAEATDAATMLVEAGRLILEENRVAVSMLQRRFGIQFEEACTLLDQLQEVGLIGPYVGGRNRDILLDAEQWEAMSAELAAS